MEKKNKKKPVLEGREKKERKKKEKEERLEIEWKGIRRRSIRRGMRRNLVVRKSKVDYEVPYNRQAGGSKRGTVRERVKGGLDQLVGWPVDWSLLLFSEAQWPAIWRFLDRVATTLGLTSLWPLPVLDDSPYLATTTYNWTKWKEWKARLQPRPRGLVSNFKITNTLPGVPFFSSIKQIVPSFLRTPFSVCTSCQQWNENPIANDKWKYYTRCIFERRSFHIFHVVKIV